MKALPQEVWAIFAELPEDRPYKVILNTNGRGHWEVEVFARYVIDVPPAGESPGYADAPARARKGKLTDM